MKSHRSKAHSSDFTLAILGTVLFVAVFAFGLRWLDVHYAVPGDASAPRPSPALQHKEGVTDALSSAFRAVLGIRTAEAAALPRYWGIPLQKTVVLEATPGQDVPVEIHFKNTGSTAWSPEGKSYVSAYTVRPRYHASVFRTTSWLSSRQPAKIATARTKTGGTGVLKFIAKAPTKPGTYTDIFQLAAEDTSWIWGAFVTVKINVKSAVSRQPSAVSTTQGTVASAPPPQETLPEPAALKGMLVYRSVERVEAPGGLDMTMRVTIKNLGATTWKGPGLKLVSAKAADGSEIDISGTGWASSDLAVITKVLVPPNQNADIFFDVMTPRKKGDYALRFVLVSDGAALDGVPIDIPVKVISDAPVIVPQEDVITAPQSQPSAPPPVTLSGDPIIRVGLYVSDKTEEIGSEGPFEARNTEGVVLAKFSAGSRVRFWYDLGSRVYRISGAGVDMTSADPIRFVQTGSAPAFTLWSFERRPRWNPAINDNTFRGTIELRKNDRNDYVWLIDELPMELYLRGMGETSNISPLEFQKALATAARTYAYWHWSHPGKHWHFTVDAVWDQVYLGYGAEIRLPRWVSAIDATRGQMVSYGGQVVVTPYFSMSDGRTRAWTEVWGGGDKPWLRSVACVHDAAAKRTLFGHGVGMSAWDAIGMANSGQAFDAILRYYYQGTELKKIY